MKDCFKLVSTITCTGLFRSSKFVFPSQAASECGDLQDNSERNTSEKLVSLVESFVNFFL